MLKLIIINGTFLAYIHQSKNEQSMKNYTYISNLLLVFSILFAFTNCSSDNLNSGKSEIPLFSESDLSIIHGDSEKSWRITDFINFYHNPTYHLEIELPCLVDDIYTFSSTNSAFSVDLGEERCFGQNDDGIFTSDTEIFDGELIFMDASQGETIYLRFSRGYSNENDTAGGISIRYFTLAELTDARMVFHRAGGEYIGEYNEALIFEKI